MELQEVFDTAYLGLLKQGEKSQDGGSCKYRSDTGLKCAAGMLIPDEMYNSKIENSNVLGALGEMTGWREYLTGDPLIVEPYITAPQVSLLLQMQRVHDHDRLVTWMEKFKQVALVYRLTLPEVKINNLPQQEKV